MCRPAMKNVDSRSIINSILSMAEQEMKEVVDLPVEAIGEAIDKLAFYYGIRDKWNSQEIYQEMAERFRGKDNNVCHSGYSHSLCH